MESKLPKWLQLFLSFLKIGAFTFGGGYAMISFLESEFVSRKKWLGKEEFLDMLGVAESTPGPIAVNAATYIGYRVAGVLGALLSTIAVCLPAFTIIFVISLFFDRFLALTYVGYAFLGIRAGVVYLIGSAGVKVIKDMKKSVFSIVVASVVLIVFVTLSILSVNFSSVFYILIAGVLGLLLYLIGKARARDAKAQEASAPVDPVDETPAEGAEPIEHSDDGERRADE